MTKTARFTLAACAAVALAACSSSTNANDGGTPDDGGANATACASYATAECGLYSSCTNGWYIASNYGDLATCVSRTLSSCEARLAVPGTAQNATTLGACTTSLATSSCEDLYGNNLTSCFPPAGALAAGTACAASAQCASAFCGIATDAICSTCQTAPGAGDSCATTGCGTGLHCLDTVDTCATLVVDGGACNADGDCEFGLTCLSKGLFCAPTADGGAPCDYTDKIGPGCDDRSGLVCERIGDGGACALKSLAGATAACGNVNDDGVDTNCEANGFCQRALPDAGTGVCVSAAGDGAACTVDGGPGCLLPARCVPSVSGELSGTCQEPYPSSCPSSSGTGTTGGTTSGTGSTSGGSSSGSGVISCSGTLAVSGADSGTGSGTLTDFGASLSEFITGDTGYQFAMAANNGDGMSSATFTMANITSYTMVSSIVFPNPPAVGTITSSQSCGNVGISYGTNSEQLEYGFTAQVAGSACVGQVAGGGSWTLTFTSVNTVQGSIGSVYTAHGSLTATMPDGMGDNATLNLTF